MAKKYEDIDSENIRVFEMIKKDSEKIKDITVDKQVLEQIKNNSKPKKKVYKKISAVAACLVLILSVLLWQNMNFNADKQGEKLNKQSISSAGIENKTNIKIAKSYDEINKLLEKIKSNHHLQAKSTTIMSDGLNFKEGVEDVQNNTEKKYSDTNEQTENVHEGDVVKTDGDYIYILSPKANSRNKQSADCEYCWDRSKYKLTIVRVNGQHTQKISITDIGGEKGINFTNIEMYISGNDLVVVGDVVTGGMKEKWTTYILNYDISDKQNVILKCKNRQDGSYTTSRLADGYLYTISGYDVSGLGSRKRIPKINNEEIAYDNIYIPNKADDMEFTIITSFKIGTNQQKFVNNISVLGGADKVYVSNKNIYLVNDSYETKDITDLHKGESKYSIDAQRKNVSNYKAKEIRLTYKNKGYDLSQITKKEEVKMEKNYESTNIVKYRYDKGKIAYIADRELNGNCDDRFSLDEKDGYLRIVMHVNNVTAHNVYNVYFDKNNKEITAEYKTSLKNKEERYNNVYVLGSVLDTVSSITKLAKNEDIYAVRFLGDYGYFVSFENTDPLFSIDFKDMKNPKVVGKLKMPGFSDYLQFYDDDLLFGFGMNGGEDGDINGLKMDMYDVSNGSASQKNKKILSEYDYSSALYDNKGLLVDKDKELIGFAAEKYDNSKYGYTVYYVLYTYKGGRFSRLLEMPIGKESENIRGFYVDNWFYIVNPVNKIKIINLNNYKKAYEIKI